MVGILEGMAAGLAADCGPFLQLFLLSLEACTLQATAFSLAQYLGPSGHPC